MAPSLLLLVPALALGSSAHVDVVTSLRTAGQARSLAQGPGTAQTEGELVVGPSAQLRVADAGTRLTLEYAPSLTVRNVLEDASPDVLHGGLLRLELVPDTRRRYFVQGQLSVGSTRFGALEPLPGGAPVDTDGAVPAPGTSGEGVGQAPTIGTPRRVLAVLAIDARAGLELQLTRRLAVSGTGGFQQSGGRTPEARTLLPLQRGPLAEARVGWSATRLDRLGLEAVVRETHFLDAPAGGAERIRVSALLLRWDRQLGADTVLGLGAGVGGGQARAAGADEDVQVVQPAASVSVEHAFSPQRLVGGLTLAFTPGADPFTARLERRVELRSALRWTPRERLGVELNVGGAGGVLTGAEERRRTLVGGTRVLWGLGDRLALETFARAGVERLGTGAADRVEWQAGAGLTVSREGHF